VEQRRIVARVEALTHRLDQARQARQAALAEVETFLDSQLDHAFSEFELCVPLGSFVRIQGGFAFKSASYISQGVPLIRISNLVNNTVVADRNVCIPLEIAKVQSAFQLREGDVLIALSGATTGKLGVVPAEGDGWLLNQRVGRFVPRDLSKTDKRFVFWAAKRVQKLVLESAYGGAQPNISPKDIEQIDFPFPSLDEQRAIVARLDALRGKLDELQRLQREVEAELASFTPALLAKAFRAEL
jgi:type I restriction enzyme S subunit